MKKFKLITALLALAAFGAVLAKNIAKPDFAFPSKAVTESATTLSDLLKTNDTKGIVRSLINYSLARNEISTDYIPADIRRVDSIAAAESDPAARSILRLLEAEMLSGIYTADMWKYNRRELPPEPISADCFEWSGNQFRDRISTLLAESTADPEQLIHIPVTDWSDVITISTESRQLYPTIFDFVAWRAIDLYKRLNPNSFDLPARCMTPDHYLDPLPSTGGVSEYDRNVYDLYRDLIRLHADNPAPRILAQVEAAKYITNGRTSLCNPILLQIYRDNKSTPWCALPLEELSIPADSLYPILTEFIATYPDYANINTLKNDLNLITTPSVRVSYPEIFPPARPVNVKLAISNARDISVTFKHIKTGRVTTSSLHLDIPIPYSADTLISVSLPLPGEYTVTSSVNGNKLDVRYPSKLRASSFDAIDLSFMSECYVYAVDPLTGAPVKGVTVDKRANRSEKYTNIGVTGADGEVRFPISKSWASNALRLTNSTDTTFFSFSTYTQFVAKPALSAQLFTDLALYHPGDTLRWALIAYNDSASIGRREIASGQDLTVTISDTNGQVCYTQSVTTDNSGRAVGSCTLPAEGLSGSYSIKASDANGSIAHSFVTVNDYKLPTFTVQADSLRKTLIPDSLVTVTFTAKTYSGFPVQGASVTLQLGQWQLNSWRWRNDISYFWSTTSTTDAAGKVSLVIPYSTLALAPDQGGYFSVNVVVTTPSGETQTAQTSFSTGKPYYISSDIPSAINLDSKELLVAGLLDANNHPVSLPLHINLYTADNKPVAAITPGNPLPSEIASGCYVLEITPADTLLASPLKQDVTLYHSSGKCPFTSLTFPVTAVDAKSGKATLLYANPFPDANLLIFEMVDSVITSRRWVKKDAGMHSLNVVLPTSAYKAKVLILTFRDNRLYSASAAVTNPDYLPRLTIETETFRDKVVPGDKETISLLFKDKAGNPIPAYAMLGMSSSALQKLAANTWQLGRILPPTPYWDTNSTGSSSTLYNSKPAPSLQTLTFSQPAFEFYGLSFYPTRGGKRYLKLRGSQTDAGAFNGEVMFATEIVEEKAYASAAPMMEAAMASGDNAVSTSEEADDAEAPNQVSADDFQYRPSEIPLAFFEPTLQSDSDGRLTYTYTVPDANTEWTFQALAYTPAIVTDRLTRSVVASRPVMVQSNLPRFLRYGDETRIQASVMNLSDTAIQAVTTVTILDASSMRPLLTRTFTATIFPLGSTTVSTDYTVPADGCQALIYRIKSTAGTHSDGEQDIIPLLPPSQPVVTTEPFFIPAASSEASLSINAPAAGASSTLYLYTNPLWEVITALPSISDGTPATAVSAASSLYKAAVARGLMGSYPEIRRGLSDWLSSNRADSTLTSMLERNDAIKQLTLNATPWVRQAMSDSERLGSLALMTDDKNTDKAIAEAIRAISNLRKPDGGFAWSPGGERSSQWATEQVLTYVTWLDLLGYRPACSVLDALVSGALGYLDDLARETYDKYGSKADYTNYVFLRSLLAGVKATPLSDRLTGLTVQKILKTWTNRSLSDKALYAVILSRNGYPAMARRLMASVASFAMTSPEKGMWWAKVGTAEGAGLLKSFELVDPSDRKAIDAIAQWLILSKTAQDWGNSAATAASVQAIIAAIPADQAATASTSVTLDGASVANDAPQLPGMTVSDISSRILPCGSSLLISKPTGLPAMGAVITRAVIAMDSIEAHSCPSVSVSKRLNLVTGTGVTAADSLRVGDRVRVQLVITATDRVDYVTIVDRNAACMEPAQQLSGYSFKDGLAFYRETTDTDNRMYIESLLPGTYIIDYEMYITASGSYSSGVATLQSQINPAIDANSSARRIIVKP